jgi:hypothetical protein
MEIKMFESERSLKFAAKRCQYLYWEVYELIPEGIVRIDDTYNAGMMVPSSRHVHSRLCDEMHRLMVIRSIKGWLKSVISSAHRFKEISPFGRGWQKMKKWNYK